MGSKFSSIVELWETTQVELHGRYSEKRVLQLAAYATHSSWVRVVGVLVATPLPCLAVTVLVDILPLADPSEGLSANSMFILREYCSYLVMNFLASQQFRTSVPALPFPIQRVVRNTIVMSTLCAGVYYGFALTIGFPVPFSIVMVMPAWVVILSTSIVLEWAEKIRQTPGTGRMVLNVVKVWMCEVLLVLIYPPFFYIFTTLTESTQMAFALLLPVIKIFMRNVFMRTVVHLRDDLPEVVVFNVEVFNALFVSYCMQNSPSFWTTLELMLADIVLLVLSVRDIEIARRGLEDLERRIGARNTKSHTTLERVEAILQRVELSSQKSERGPTLAKIGPESVTTVKKSLVVTRVDALSTFAMAPHPLRAAKQLIGKGTVSPVVPQIAVATKEAFKPSVGLSYTRKVRRLLFMTEFVLLLNYVEVVIPLVFSMYMFVMYHLPNRAYYAQLADLDEDQLLQTLKNVLFYCSLQLLSLLVLAFALQRKLGLSSIRQLSFVLEKQFAGAQIKLIFWVFYNVQASLKHSGYDYTFHFDWLRTTPEDHRTSA